MDSRRSAASESLYGQWVFTSLRGRGEARRSPSREQHLEHDDELFPSRRMAGFILWNQQRVAEFSRNKPGELAEGISVDGDGYSAWLKSLGKPRNRC